MLIGSSKTTQANTFRLLLSFFRFLSIFASCFWLHLVTLDSLYFVYLIPGFTFSVIILYIWHRNHPTLLNFDFRVDRILIPFAAGGIVRAAQQNIDRLILPFFLNDSGYTFYVLYIRGVFFANLPMLAVMRQHFPVFVNVGHSGIQACVNYAVENARYPLFSGILGSITIIIYSAFIYSFSDFSGSNAVLTAFISSFIPLGTAITYWSCEVLTACGMQKKRVAIFLVQLLVQISIQVPASIFFGVSGALFGVLFATVVSSAIAAYLLFHLAGHSKNKKGSH